MTTVEWLLAYVTRTPTQSRWSRLDVTLVFVINVNIIIITIANIVINIIDMVSNQVFRGSFLQIFVYALTCKTNSRLRDSLMIGKNGSFVLALSQ